MAGRRTRTARTADTDTATTPTPDAPTTAVDTVPATGGTDMPPTPDTAPTDDTGASGAMPHGDPATPDTDTATPPTPALTQELMAAAMKIASEDTARHAAAQAELERIAAEEEARRQQVLADLAKARTIEDTRAALGDLLAAVTTAYLSLAEEDVDEATVTERLETVYVAANDLRRASRVSSPRSTRPTASGSGVVTVRADRAAPRPLRPEVAAHLATYPDKDFTPGEIGKVLDRSSGAVANALDRLVQDGQAVLSSEKPHRYRAATQGADAASTADVA